MAIGLMNRIWWRQDLDTSEKMVLLALADRADDDGVCWYAVETICRKTSLSRRGAQKVINRLVERLLLRKVHRHDRSNFYVIPVDRFPDVSDVARPAKERGSLEYIEEEPDLFGRGERGAPRRGARGSGRGAPGTIRGEPGAPDSLSDSLIDSTPDAGARAETIPELVVRSWNELAEKHSSLVPFRGELSAERISRIETRAAEWRNRLPADPPLDLLTDPSPEEEVWIRAFQAISTSKLLTGQKTDWAPTFDWVLGPKNFAKIMEGNYGHGHDRVGAPSTSAAGRSAVAAGQEARDIIQRARGRGAGPGAGGHSHRATGTHS